MTCRNGLCLTVQYSTTIKAQYCACINISPEFHRAIVFRSPGHSPCASRFFYNSCLWLVYYNKFHFIAISIGVYIGNSSSHVYLSVDLMLSINYWWGVLCKRIRRMMMKFDSCQMSGLKRSDSAPAIDNMILLSYCLRYQQTKKLKQKINQ